jgi:hypothetical protein
VNARWAKVLDDVQRRRPEAVSPDWRRTFEDHDKLAAVLRDTIKFEQRSTRTGTRVIQDEAQAAMSLSALAGDLEYTALPFTAALRNLVTHRGWSVRQLAERIGTSHTQARRYLVGTAVPPVEAMSSIAGAFKKPATYFREYRAIVIAAAVAEEMDRNPDRSAALCNNMRRIPA